jgi:hypothetical protein
MWPSFRPVGNTEETASSYRNYRHTEETASSYRNYRPSLRIVVGEQLSVPVSVSADGSWGKGRVVRVLLVSISVELVYKIIYIGAGSLEGLVFVDLHG